MADTIWEAGDLQQVWIPAGKNDNGAMRFTRAGFDILKWAQSSTGDKETYINTVGNEQITDEELNITGQNEWQRRAEFGSYTIEPMVIQTHQGDGSDNLLGLHHISYI